MKTHIESFYHKLLGQDLMATSTQESDDKISEFYNYSVRLDENENTNEIAYHSIYLNETYNDQHETDSGSTFFLRVCFMMPAFFFSFSVQSSDVLLLAAGIRTRKGKLLHSDIKK